MNQAALLRQCRFFVVPAAIFLKKRSTPVGAALFVAGILLAVDADGFADEVCSAFCVLIDVVFEPFIRNIHLTKT